MGSWWVGVEGEFSERLWLELSLGQAEQKRKNVVNSEHLVPWQRKQAALTKFHQSPEGWIEHVIILDNLVLDKYSLQDYVSTVTNALVYVLF